MRHASLTRQARQPKRARGFSLTELMVVISIAGLLIGISFPVISSIIGGSKVSNGISTIGMSADVARQWVAAAAWAPDSTDPNPQNERYSGTAAIICPNREIRITANFRLARDSGGAYLEDIIGAGTVSITNGYRDIDGVDYVKLPSGVGVLGIKRSGATVRLVAPPFAIAFSENGQLTYGDGNGFIYYDGDGDNRFDLNDDRGSSYDPVAWDGTDGSSNADPISSTNPRNALPFEAIECVPGVIIYDADEFESAGNSLGADGTVTLGSSAGNWLQENGTSLFFSPHTGSPLYDEEGN